MINNWSMYGLLLSVMPPASRRFLIKRPCDLLRWDSDKFMLRLFYNRVPSRMQWVLTDRFCTYHYNDWTQKELTFAEFKEGIDKMGVVNGFHEHSVPYGVDVVPKVVRAVLELQARRRRFPYVPKENLLW